MVLSPSIASGPFPMSAKERAVLLRSLGAKFWKILFAERAGRTFQCPPAGTKVSGPQLEIKIEYS
jgi:hypothetical protein